MKFLFYKIAKYLTVYYSKHEINFIAYIFLRYGIINCMKTYQRYTLSLADNSNCFPFLKATTSVLNFCKLRIYNLRYFYLKYI